MPGRVTAAGRLAPSLRHPRPPDTRASVGGRGAWPARGNTHSGTRSSCSALAGHPGFLTVEAETQNHLATSSLCLSASRRGTWTLLDRTEDRPLSFRQALSGRGPADRPRQVSRGHTRRSAKGRGRGARTPPRHGAPVGAEGPAPTTVRPGLGPGRR